MIYRATILNISAGLYLIACLLYTAINYGRLSSGGGWGVIAMIGLIALGVGSALVDLILQQFIKRMSILNIFGAIMVLSLAALLLIGL